MKYKLVSFTLLMCVVLQFSVSAVPLSSILDKHELPASETIEWTNDEKLPILNLLPDANGAGQVRESFFTYRPEITVQRLYRMEIDALKKLESDEVLLHLVNILCDTDSQTGYKYRSSRRDKRIELIEESYRVDNDDNKTDDLHFGSLAEAGVEKIQKVPADQPLASIEFRQYIKEANFRGAIFEQVIYIGKDWIRFTSTNEERLWVKIFPLMKAKGFRNEFFLFKEEGNWYVYGSSQIESMPTLNQLFGEPVHLPSMYRKRMDVYKAWMRDQLVDRLK